MSRWEPVTPADMQEGDTVRIGDTGMRRTVNATSDTGWGVTQSEDGVDMIVFPGDTDWERLVPTTTQTVKVAESQIAVVMPLDTVRAWAPGSAWSPVSKACRAALEREGLA